MSKGRKGKCAVPGCDRDAHTAGVCSPCYQGLYYWRNATPGKLLKRMKQLQVLEARMEMRTNIRIVGKRRAG